MRADASTAYPNVAVVAAQKVPGYEGLGQADDDAELAVEEKTADAPSC